jgi:NAD(P)-dependent dehydrogenase (short-subunit alcohol dehydrogenase family)
VTGTWNTVMAAAEPEDIAYAVCWLASEESKNVTAAAISIDQGMTQY